MGKVSITGNISQEISRQLKDPTVSNIIKRQVITESVKRTAAPIGAAARRHYINVLQEVSGFISDSGVSNADYGFITRQVKSPGSGSVSVTSIYPWKPLSKKYVRNKKSSILWRNTGQLSRFASNLPRFGATKLGRARIKLNPKFSASLGKFNFPVIFQTLPAVFETAVGRSFADGKAVDPASLPNVPLNPKRSGINRIIFLERYRDGQVKGGPGRPMITAISGALGKIMKTDLIALARKVS